MASSVKIATASKLQSQIILSLRHHLGRNISCRVEHIAYHPDGNIRTYMALVTTDNDVYKVKRNTDYHSQQTLTNAKFLFSRLPHNTAEPLFFLPKLSACVTRYIPGQPLLNVKTARLPVLFSQIGHLTAQVHHQSTKSYFTQPGSGTLRRILQTINRGGLARIKKVYPKIYPEMARIYRVLMNSEEQKRFSQPRRMIIGDWHPGNIVIDQQKNPVIIDVDDLTIGSIWRDVGTWIEQTESLYLAQKSYTVSSEVVTLQRAFLRGYNRQLKISDQRIVFYRAWAAWRNALYFTIIDRPQLANARYCAQKAHHYLESLGLI